MDVLAGTRAFEPRDDDNAPPPRARSPRRRRRIVVVLVALALGCGILTRLDTQVRTAVGAEGTGQGSFPVVEVAGLGSNGHGFAHLTTSIQSSGGTVLDFDPATPGAQALTYDGAGASIPTLAVDVVQPAIREALSRAGYDPDTQVVDVVAHSLGGLLMRYLIEHPVAGWAAQVDDLVMVATPNHGSDVIYWETRGSGSRFATLGSQMRPGSAFLRRLGTTEPAGEVYTAVGGDPWIFRWYRHGDHGFDDQVPTESAFMTGAALDTFDHFHGKLLPAEPVVALIVETLRSQ